MNPHPPTRMPSALIHFREIQSAIGTSIEPGTTGDYQALARYHYRSAHPGAVSDVLRITIRQPTVVGRFLQRRDETQLAGVLVRSLPSLSCRLRDVATSGRYQGLTPRERAVMLNREVRCISRVVIDPQFRGCGLAVRLVRHALANPHPKDTYFTEALAAMGRVSPFFERAGMMRYDQPLRSRPARARMLDALQRLAITPCMLASRRLIESRTNDLGQADVRWLTNEMRRWHRAAHRTDRQTLDRLSFDELLNAARHELLLSPVYYLFAHPPP